MRHDLERFDSAEALARAGARFVADRARECVEARGSFSLALSGGRTPRRMFAELAALDAPWERTVVFQVDERVAAAGDAERNLTGLEECLGGASPVIEAMPVEDEDLESAARRYEAVLPARFDLVHLGLGADGHTASLVPDDAVLDVTDRLVAVTGEYQGHRRMTLTFPGLALADQLLWLVTGEEKRPALDALIQGDRSIPAGRVVAARSLVMTDLSAP